ncbi:hypothetical protein D3C78_1596350 [compost metagenome]
MLYPLPGIHFQMKLNLVAAHVNDLTFDGSANNGTIIHSLSIHFFWRRTLIFPLKQTMLENTVTLCYDKHFAIP